YLTRFGEGMLPAAGTLYQDGDTVHAMLGVDRSSEVAHILAKSPAKES
ncbi:MAG TPA: potassium transporter TrkA, partial [Arthrobacter sp.]|nr:potassium transporter TrkA [Arthrobacter sp.]